MVPRVCGGTGAAFLNSEEVKLPILLGTPCLKDSKISGARAPSMGKNRRIFGQDSPPESSYMSHGQSPFNG